MKNSSLMWGEYNAGEKSYNGYQMLSDGTLKIYFRDSTGIIKTNEYKKLNDKDACKILGLYYWGMKTVQVCNEPGEKLNFLTFVNNETNTFWNVKWNKKFNSVTNKNLKVIGDSIEYILKRIEKK